MEDNSSNNFLICSIVLTPPPTHTGISIKPIALLAKTDFEVEYNLYGRKMTEDEILNQNQGLDEENKEKSTVRRISLFDNYSEKSSESETHQVKREPVLVNSNINQEEINEGSITFSKNSLTICQG